MNTHARSSIYFQKVYIGDSFTLKKVFMGPVQVLNSVPYFEQSYFNLSLNPMLNHLFVNWIYSMNNTGIFLK